MSVRLRWYAVRKLLEGIQYHDPAYSPYFIHDPLVMYDYFPSFFLYAMGCCERLLRCDLIVSKRPITQSMIEQVKPLLTNEAWRADEDWWQVWQHEWPLERIDELPDECHYSDDTRDVVLGWLRLHIGCYIVRFAD